MSVIEVIDGLDLVVRMAEGFVHPDDLAAAHDAARRARLRHGHLGGTLVVALVGGTGSGKSSLLNALADSEVASVSAVRPHTSRPLAWIPEGVERSLSDLLDRLGVRDRVAQDVFAGLAIIDMTDIDSVETGHRESVERLLPEVDAVVWVLDPVKYHDPILHEDFVAPLADSADRFVFVLNQVDRLTDDEANAVMVDLRATLFADGIQAATLFATAASPTHGDRIGIDALADHLQQRLDAKRVRLSKLLADTRAAARGLARAAGVRQGGSLDFEARWSDLLDGVVASLSLSGPAPGVIEEVLCGLEDFVGHLAAEAGGPFAVRMRNGFGPARLEASLREAISLMEAEVPRPIDGPEPIVEPEQRARAADVLASELQRRLGAPLRKLLWERASLSATVAEVTVGVTLAEAALRDSEG